jgi:hypothetical protein
MSNSSIFIYLDKPGHVPGEMVTGKIYIHLPENVMCNSLDVRVRVARSTWCTPCTQS